MVTLNLLTTDDQTDKYLKKNMIHKSVSELLNQGQPKPLRGNFLPDCGAVKNDNKVLFVNCPGDIALVSLAGSLKMTCRELEGRRLFGPVYIRGEDCGQSILFDWTCEDIKSLGTSTTRCSNDPLSPWEYLMCLMSVIFFLSTVALICFSIKLSRYESKIAEKYPMNVEGCKLEYTMMTFINGEGETEHCDPRQTLPLNGIRETKKKNLIMLFLLMLFCRPWGVESYEIASHIPLKSGLHTYSLIIGESEVIPVGVDGIYRNKQGHSGQLVKMFNTYDWNIEVKQNYYCQWKSCDNLMHCRQGMQSFQNASIDVMSFLELNHNKPSYATCQRQHLMCQFGWGCIIIGFNLNLNEDSKFTVYSISKGGDHGGKIHVPYGCHVESFHSELTGGIEDHYLVTSRSKGTYLCHKLLFSLKVANQSILL